MRIGLYLQGGGAKGAFQGGALTFLKEKEVKYTVVSGTSIGAVNGYIILKDSIDKFKKIYTENNDEETNKMKFSGKTIDNSILIDQLKYLSKNSDANEIEAFYVNYIKINGINLEEKIVDVKQLSDEDAISAVSYSSLLPYNLEVEKGISEFKEILDKDFEKINENFQVNLMKGEYEGMNLDGGLVNNYFIPEILNHSLDRVLIIGLKKEQEYLDKLFNKNGIPKNLVFINCEREFKNSDTINFSNNFTTELFNEGYEKAKEIFESGLLS